jgi:hypothetical protein
VFASTSTAMLAIPGSRFPFSDSASGRVAVGSDARWERIQAPLLWCD